MSMQKSGEKPKGHWIPWLFVGFFGIVLIANGSMIYAAMSTWNGLAAQRSFDKGLAYNNNLKAAREQAALGWEMDVAYEDGRLVVDLRDDRQRPIFGAAIEATLERPDNQNLDFGMALQARSDGRYVAELGDVLPGLWNVHLVAGKHDGRLVRDERLLIR